MSAQPLDLVVFLNPRAIPKGVLTVSVGGREACRVEVTGAEEGSMSCRAALPVDTQRLSVEWNPGALLRSRRQRHYTVFSIADLTARVRQAAPASSMRGLVDRVDALLARLGADDRAGDLGLAVESTVAAERLVAAEARLGFPLDPELTQWLTTTGRVTFEDSRMVGPDEFDLTERQFETLWGHPERPDPKAAAIYRSSTMVWVEAGDGYGAIVYQPRGPERCGGGPTYWRIHQEWIHEPELVTAANGACGGLRHALFPMFLRDLLEQIDDRTDEHQLLVDPSASELHAWLSIERDGTPRIRPSWSTLR